MFMCSLNESYMNCSYCYQVRRVVEGHKKKLDDYMAFHLGHISLVRTV